jgi:D-threo-aldose 1-dehydrogenase
MTENIDVSARRPVGDRLAVPAICFGTSALGNMPGTYGYEVDEARARETLLAILSSLCPFLDASRNYGFGESERRVGAVIRELGGLPEAAVVSTKLDRDMQSNRFDADRARRSLEESLEALGLDRVHILHLHDPEYAASIEDVTRPDGALRELHRMKDDGLAEAIGLAAGNVEVMLPILRDWEFDVMITHSRFTLVNRNAEEMIDYACSKGIAVFNAAPYSSGVLAKGADSYPRYVYQEASREALEPVRKVEALCREHGIPLGAAALQFSLRDQRIASTICGVSKPERVQQTLEWASVRIPDETWDALMALPFSAQDPEASREYRPD